METCPSCGTPLPEGARFCPGCAAPVERQPPTEERKVATLLFADLVGSTQLGEQDPERTRALLDRFYDAMAAEVTRAGGTVEKFAGDAVMAAFGAPAAHEDHAERALHTALAMRRRMQELFGGRLELRIGVNTGDVVVGRAREGSSFVTGDAVNVCARLEQHAAPGEILVGERTAHAVRGAFEFDAPTAIDAKGKHEPVACRRLVRALSLMRPRGVGGLKRTFVGRSAELELLQATYRRTVHEREPHLVTIVGNAGVGKSRLVRELWEWLGDQAEEPLRRTGRCLPYGSGITYWALGEILKEHLGILETDATDDVHRRLGSREILGLTLGLDVARDLHPLAARDRLQDAWVDFIAELGSDRPVVLLVEDLHWAEDDLLDLIERVVRDAHAPVLMIATARPELLDRRAGWGGGRRNTSSVWLEPLTADEASLMLEELLPLDLPDEVRKVVVERAEGNPFFVEELTATLIDQGVLHRSGDGWRVGELPDDFAVPDSVHGVLAARIDLLPPTEKAALQAGSVVGRVFWAGPILELLDVEQVDFELLEERDFIRRRPGSSVAGEREFAIKHSLTREVAYGSLPKAKRARLHARFAAWLERLGDRDDLAPLLAHHYAEAVRLEDADLAWAGEEQELARLRERALDWLERAAAAALTRYELDDALTLLQRAVALVPDEPRQAELWRAIGRAHALRFDGEAFWTAMQNSLRVCTNRPTCADTLAELSFQTAMRSAMWKRRPDPELVQGWTREALELAEPDSPARVKALIARALLGPGGAEAAREADELANRLDDAELRSWALGARAFAALDAGETPEGVGWAERRLDLLREITDPDHHTDIYATAVWGQLASGKLGDARRLAVLHDEVASELTPHHRLHGIGHIVLVEELAGAWNRIRELTGRIEEDVDANIATPCVMNARTLLASAVAAAQLRDAAESERLEQAADELGMEGYELQLNATRIELALARGDLGRVESLVSTLSPEELSFGMVTPLRARLDALVALGERARVEEEAPRLLRPDTYLEPFALRALGVVRNDEDLLRQAIARFESAELDWHAGQTRALLST